MGFTHIATEKYIATGFISVAQLFAQRVFKILHQVVQVFDTD